MNPRDFTAGAAVRALNATRKARWVIVRLTADHIARGVKSGCYDCALALALREATGLAWHVMDRDARIEVQNGRAPLWHFPEHVREIVSRFDHRWPGPLEPTQFRLPSRFADPKWKRLGASACS